MSGNRTPDLDSLRLEPTTRLGDPTGFQVPISIQPGLRVARWVSPSLPRLESLHTEKLYLIPKDCYWFSLTWLFSLLFIWRCRTATRSHACVWSASSGRRLLVTSGVSLSAGSISIDPGHDGG